VSDRAPAGTGCSQNQFNLGGLHEFGWADQRHMALFGAVHTHPNIAWFEKRHEWQRYRAYLSATVHVRFPWGIDRLMHNIMEHNAHHLNPRIPMYSLRKAQKLLTEKFDDQFQAYRMTWNVYRECVRRCKLYDFANHAWLDFKGEVTSRVELLGDQTAAKAA
jgi:hypothetical protein